jgi:hypothetical protein
MEMEMEVQPRLLHMTTAQGAQHVGALIDIWHQTWYRPHY